MTPKTERKNEAFVLDGVSDRGRVDDPGRSGR